MKRYYLYLMASRKNGTLYLGVTNTLKRRVYEHKQKLILAFSSRYNVDKLVYFKEYLGIRDAIVREKQLKEWKRQGKIRLIEEFNPSWRDLYGEID